MLELQGIGKAINSQNLAALKSAWVVLGEIIKRAEGGEVERQQQLDKLRREKRETDSKERLKQIASKRRIRIR